MYTCVDLSTHMSKLLTTLAKNINDVRPSNALSALLCFGVPGRFRLRCSLFTVLRHLHYWGYMSDFHAPVRRRWLDGWEFLFWTACEATSLAWRAWSYYSSQSTAALRRCPLTAWHFSGLRPYHVVPTPNAPKTWQQSSLIVHGQMLFLQVALALRLHFVAGQPALNSEIVKQHFNKGRLVFLFICSSLPICKLRNDLCYACFGMRFLSRGSQVRVGAKNIAKSLWT